MKLGAPTKTHYNAVPIFRTLVEDELRELIEISRLLKAAAGRVILTEGTAGNGLWVLLSGTCACELRGLRETPTELATLSTGDFFGEMSLLDDEPISATVSAVEDSLLLHIPKEPFNEFRTALRPVAYKILRAIGPTICQRLRTIRARIETIYEDPEPHLHRTPAAGSPVDRGSEGQP